MPTRRSWMIPLVLLTALAGCGKKADPGGEATVPEATARDSGIVVLEPDAVEAAGIRVAPAGPATIDVTVEMPGEVHFDPQRVLELHPRFAGVVRSMRKQVGQQVGRGEVVASIESNESLTEYAVSSSIAGRVIARAGAPGEAVTPDATIYTIADLSKVWVDFAVYPNDLERIRTGERARVVPQARGEHEVAGTVSYVGPSLQPGSRVSVGRVVLPNRDGRWEPGLFANVIVTVDHVRAAVAVPDEAIVRTNDGPVVFIANGNRFQKQLVTTGRTDGRMTEITKDLAAGAPVVVHGGFILRTELEKEHE